MYGEDERFPTPRTRRGYYPTSREDRSDEEWFRGGLGNMVRMFGSALPKEFDKLARIVGTNRDVREQRVGPFVYGFSYTSEPGKEPIFQEFGNIRPSDRGLTPGVDRTPMIDVMDKGDFYEMQVELTGVEKSNINLDFHEDNFVVVTRGDRRYRARTILRVPVDPNTADATYKDGVLHIRVEKAEEYKPSKTIGTKVPVE
ncbi:MAG: Hsp20/alpha crystallin family protein [Methanotrichaceae archaeon]